MTTIREVFETMDYGPAPESPQPAHDWLDRHGRRLGHFIGGEWRAAAESFETRNPATTALLASVGQGSAADVDAAVRAARAALPAWQALGPHGR